MRRFVDLHALTDDALVAMLDRATPNSDQEV